MSYYEQPEPTQAEQDLYDRLSDNHPDWTDQQLWDEVERELEARAEYAAEYYAEQWRDFGEY